MKLTDEQIQKYSNMFHQSSKVIVSIASMYDNLMEIEKNLYELGEEHLPEDNEIEDDEDFDEEDDELLPEEVSDKINELLPIIKEHISNKLGIPVENLEGKVHGFKVNKDLYNHLCPFTDKQRKNISCEKCPLHLNMFIPMSFEIAIENNISIPEAIEYIKFNMYHHTEEAYQKLLKESSKNSTNDNDTNS